jgi:hypothetical protein
MGGILVAGLQPTKTPQGGKETNSQGLNRYRFMRVASSLVAGTSRCFNYLEE